MAENQISRPVEPSEDWGQQAKYLYALAEELNETSPECKADMQRLQEGLAALCSGLCGQGAIAGLSLTQGLPLKNASAALRKALGRWLPPATHLPNSPEEEAPQAETPLLLWPKTEDKNPCRSAIEKAGLHMIAVLAPEATEGFSDDVLSAEKALRLYGSQPVILLCTSLAALPYADAFPNKLLWLSLPESEGDLSCGCYDELHERATKTACAVGPPNESETQATEMAHLWKKRQKAGASLVILAPSNYDARPTRTHHLARFAAQNGRQVLWINASCGEETRLVQREGSLLAFEMAAGEGEGHLAPNGVLSAHTPDRQRQLHAQLRHIFTTMQLQRALLQVCHPFWGEAAFRMRRENRLPVLFDFHDDYTTHAGAQAKPIARAEKSLLGGADYVVAASSALAQLSGVGKARLATVRNGCDFAHFSAGKAAERQPGKPPVLGYYGAVSSILSLEVLRALETSGLELEVHLVGPASEEAKAKLSALRKVRLLGEVPYEELPNLLAGFDLALLPYNTKNPAVEIASPGKFYEYLAAGKPVVGTAVPELMVFRGRYACLENDPSWFLRRVRECLDGISQLAPSEERVRFAGQNSWQSRAAEFEAIYQKLEIVRGRTIRGDIWAERAAHGKHGAPERPMLALPPLEKKKKAADVPKMQLAAAMASLQNAEDTLTQREEKVRQALAVLSQPAAAPGGMLRSLGLGKQAGPAPQEEAATLLKESLSVGQQRANKALLRAPGSSLPALPAVYTKYDLFFFPAEEPTQWQSRSARLALQYAENGHRVFYVSPSFSGLPAVTLQQENLYLVELPGAPGATIFEEGLGEEDNTWREILDNILWHFGIRDGLSVVSYPRWLPAAQHIKDRFGLPLVADCHCDFTGFLVPGSHQSEDSGMKLLQEASVAIPSSVAVAAVVRQIRGGALPPLVENGCDCARFQAVFSPSTPCPMPEKDPDKKLPHEARRPVAGYCGVISHWFSAQMVLAAAKELPWVDFVLAGPVLEWKNELSGQPNLRLLGEIPFDEIPALVQGFDVSLLPFSPEAEITETLCPSAFFEYLAAGKKVVATRLPALAPYAGRQALLSDTTADFIAHIKAVLAGKDGLAGAEEGAKLAAESDWKNRWAAFAKLAEAAFPSVSIVLCTHNHLAALKACISSILSLTALPRYELIVADCGSTDGTATLLEELKNEDLPHLRVVTAGKGKTMAAGWNAGLREATKDYVVLMQDGCLVTRGWLSALVGPLAKDATLGLCGPATNHGGGEAKVQVHYQNEDEMTQFSYFYNWLHLGETRQKGKSLSLFCAALRRKTLGDLGPLDEVYQTTQLLGYDLSKALQKADQGLAVAEGAFVHRAFPCLPPEEQSEAEQEAFTADKKHFEEKWDSLWKPAPHRPGVTREMNAASLFPPKEEGDA